MRKFWKNMDPVLIMISSFVLIFSVIILLLSLFERLYPQATGTEAEVLRLLKLMVQIGLVVFFFIALYMIFILLNIQAILERNT